MKGLTMGHTGGTTKAGLYTLSMHLMTISSIGIGTMLAIGMGLLSMMSLTTVLLSIIYSLKVGNSMAKRGDPRLTRDYKAFRLKILQRDQWSCFYCQQPAATVDHIIPISKAPDLVVNYENAVACCASCNSKKGSRNQASFLGTMPTPYVFPTILSPMRSEIHQDSPFTARPIQN